MITRIYNISKIYTWNPLYNSLDIYKNKDILIKDGRIVEISKNIDLDIEKNLDAKNAIVTPGFIDSHTHPIFGGNRSNEYIERLEGATYDEIKKNGGGIISSILKTRECNFDQLYENSYLNIKDFIKYGTTTIEAKSGYGLSVDDEIKSLKIIKKINSKLDIDIIPTFLGAHDIPTEYIKNKQIYIDLICNKMIPQIAKEKLAVFCDVFCEPGYFNLNETEMIINKAKEYNLKPRLHVDEFVDSSGAELAVKLGAFSADHLMSVSDSGIKALAKSKTIATLLPGTTFFLNKNQYANGRKMIDQGCNVSIATDFNPGTCTIKSMSNIMHLAMQKCGLTLEEAFLGSTYNAAKSVGKENSIGLVKENYFADLILWNLTDLSEIPYWFDSCLSKIKYVIKKGNLI